MFEILVSFVSYITNCRSNNSVNSTENFPFQELTRQNIEYKKIKCEGKIVPPEKVVNRCVEIW